MYVCKYVYMYMYYTIYIIYTRSLLVPSKGPNRIGVLLPLIWRRKQVQFQKSCVFMIFRIPYNIQEPKSPVMTCLPQSWFIWSIEVKWNSLRYFLLRTLPFSLSFSLSLSIALSEEFSIRKYECCFYSSLPLSIRPWKSTTNAGWF
jgi:hypothetical protein